ncbi:sulfatase-like hydrolase/transferase [Epibacterium sp. SM1969]|uniref:Sulfatase-like hydrolase/transferase n=1 Tax=Tritonibacter aquimaris TaxID=2663379 RepID=A0A844AS93_9RHOB|nr:sulfatase-like hydrolase/transferase [Tritonibacter aquimaris]MQY43953.1 sulfatase-like hydrolase/transferase [Tritonibacter aquimaris]
MPKKILFIMCDQLRYDYLGCTGHPHIRTPNIDALAARGVRFDRTYVQSPICGPSRMSFYTGRYTRSHGALWNEHPLRVGEMTISDHLRPLGVRTVLCGKTHMTADAEGMKRLGIDASKGIGALVAECGFEIWDRNDGVVPDGAKKQPSHYNKHLKELGYGGPNPWHQWANSGRGDDGEILSGWLLKHASEPAAVAEEDSETPYTTTRAIEFMEQAKEDSWCLHLSYIKPHWPYVVPAPYHDMYGKDDIIPVNRSDAEREDPHPLLAGYYSHRYSQAFCRDDVREAVIPAYMGLITQIDDQIGRIVKYLEDSGQADETLIVFTSDHGDYLGDHWLGEKELFHDASARVPLIVVDPSSAADSTRGQVNTGLTEAIDLVPTFVDFMGGKVPDHILEGYSLLPALHGHNHKIREFAVSEYDYSARPHLRHLSPNAKSCMLTMVFDGRWKLVCVEGHRPMLYDLDTDPQELTDLGDSPDHADQISRMRDMLFDWSRRQHNRITISDQTIDEKLCREEALDGVYLGFWDEKELEDWKVRNGGT